MNVENILKVDVSFTTDSGDNIHVHTSGVLSPAVLLQVRDDQVEACATIDPAQAYEIGKSLVHAALVAGFKPPAPKLPPPPAPPTP